MLRTRTPNGFPAITPAALLLGCACLLSAPAARSTEDPRRDPGVIIRNSELKSAPTDDATTVTSLRLGNRVEVGGFRANWAQVIAPDTEPGWIPAANVRLKIAATQSDGASPLTGLLRGVAGGVGGFGEQQNQKSISGGIRGVQPSDIEGAEPDVRERRKLDQFRANPSEAEQHARESMLERRDLAYFDE